MYELPKEEDMTWEDLNIIKQEMEAYMDLEGEPFDFGTGMIFDDSVGSECIYYKMIRRNVLDRMEHSEYVEEGVVRRSQRRPQRRKGLDKRKYYKEVEKAHVRGLRGKDWMLVRSMGTHLRRDYRGKRSPFLKKVSNRKVRYYEGSLKDGASYRKVFDFWWELF